MTVRDDNSVNSANNPTLDNRIDETDFGLYKAMVLKIYYTDDAQNNTKSDKNPQIIYDLIVIGGNRDGQVFSNAQDLKHYGGISNYSERTWKAVTTLTRTDIADFTFNLETLDLLNGDVVYFQFLNGDMQYPIILGGAKHASNKKAEGAVADGPRKIDQFNGIKREITKDGEFKWTKANGFYSPVPLPDPELNVPLLQDQFVPTLGFEKAVEVSLGNKFDYKFKFNTTPAGTGLEIALDGIADTLKVTMLTGLNFTLDGLSDKASITTKAGAALTVDGLGQVLEQKTTAGTSMKIDGLADKIELKNAAGHSLAMDGAAGITMKLSSGSALEMKIAGDVSLKNAAGAKLEFAPTGFIKLGNNSAELFDLLDQAFTALSTQTAAGFNAPTSTVAIFTQLATMIKLIKGG